MWKSYTNAASFILLEFSEELIKKTLFLRISKVNRVCLLSHLLMITFAYRETTIKNEKNKIEC